MVFRLKEDEPEHLRWFDLAVDLSLSFSPAICSEVGLIIRKGRE